VQLHNLLNLANLKVQFLRPSLLKKKILVDLGLHNINFKITGFHYFVVKGTNISMKYDISRQQPKIYYRYVLPILNCNINIGHKLFLNDNSLPFI